MWDVVRGGSVGCGEAKDGVANTINARVATVTSQ